MNDKISEHFKMNEACCRCGCQKVIINGKLVTMLEKARLLACVPFKINSWCRCKAYNDSLPDSVPDSAHLEGLAVDISTDTNRAVILKSLRLAGFKRIGKGSRFIHVDIDDGKPEGEWVY